MSFTRKLSYKAYAELRASFVASGMDEKQCAIALASFAPLPMTDTDLEREAIASADGIAIIRLILNQPFGSEADRKAHFIFKFCSRYWTKQKGEAFVDSEGFYHPAPTKRAPTDEELLASWSNMKEASKLSLYKIAKSLGYFALKGDEKYPTRASVADR